MTDELNNEQMADETVYKAEQKQGDALASKAKKLFNQGLRKRLVVRKKSGEQLMDVPLAAGLAAGGVVAITAPFWAIVGGIAAAVAPISFEVMEKIEESE